MPFSNLGLSPTLQRAVSHYATPTPVQESVIPSILKGRDVLATAETGSGKTSAYLLPILERFLSSPHHSSRGIHALVLVPTRELAAQVREVVQELAVHLPSRIKIVSAVGGVSINPQMMALRGGTDILVATPGRLLDLLDQNALSLSGVKTLVLDEADRMLDAGFSGELERILSLLPPVRQNLLFSATFPTAVESFAGTILRDPVRIHLEPAPNETPAIIQRYLRVDAVKRAPLLRHLIQTEGWKRILVFVATQYAADHVADKLRRNGISALAFHGALSQGARSDALLDFKNSLIQVLVATDLASRGLDIVKLPAVINYDPPRSTDDYTHRIGRTGRAGTPGLAISFVTAESSPHYHLIEKRHRLHPVWEEISGFEPNWEVSAANIGPGPDGSNGSGGIKGHRKSKKDKLREAAARKPHEEPSPTLSKKGAL